MVKSEEIQRQLDAIIEEIGEARANGNLDTLADLRMKRDELEQEIDELTAENSYISKRDAEAVKTAHEQALKETLVKYDDSEKRYLEALKKISTTVERLNSLEDALHIQVENITSLPNPVIPIRSIWNELPHNRQQEYQTRFTDVYSRGVLPSSRIQEILDKLDFHRNLISGNADRLKVKPPESTRKYVGGRATTRKLTDQPAEPKRTRQQLEVPIINRNKPLIPGSIRPKKRPAMATYGG